MAWEKDGFTIPALMANGDMSSDQFKCVVMDTSTDNYVDLCDADGEVILGVLQNKPDAAGKVAEVRAIGVTKVVAGETLTRGMFWGTDTAGKAKQVEATATGADTGDYIAGQVLEGASANEYATVTIGFPTLHARTA